MTFSMLLNGILFFFILPVFTNILLFPFVIFRFFVLFILISSIKILSNWELFQLLSTNFLFVKVYFLSTIFYFLNIRLLWVCVYPLLCICVYILLF